jgi:Flp pilus assembly protein TadD
MRESSLESLLLLATLFVIHEKHGKAATVLEGLYAVAPRDERVLRLLCHSFVMENRNEEALEVLRELFTCAGGRMTAEETACALRLKASALWRLGRREESRAVIESI